MDNYQAVLLAIVQGMTEFLPVSSSGHLLLPSQLLGWHDQTLAFDVAVHGGSLIAIVFYLRVRLRDLIAAWWISILSSGNNRHGNASCEEAKLAWQIILASLPAAICGWSLATFIEQNLRNVFVVASATVFFGLVLGMADLKGAKNRTLKEMTWYDAIIIGCSQAIALVPGTSRSGITITSALTLGYSREHAAHFSFLMSVPIITMSLLYKGSQLMTSDSSDLAPLGIGIVFSAVTAYFCISGFMHFVTKIGMLPFVIYRILLGSALFWIAYSQ
ncbi:MAG: undecaprenyl-diphosphatase [Cellvibrionales bacterium TMED49]|nr:undecaprenyl-diphosphate phosphatase [Porticoccaceae bacterium]OUU35312.1 MAG: undecaprenyl-diphosphatase [Cellvibrionales bacterium TMED49]RPG88203.1 MAG: undecaprenyl-diphosphate phosphatase [Cellvibrionales bacterium TMED148]